MNLDKSRFQPNDPADFTELNLLRRAMPIAEAFKGQIPTRDELAEITREFGVDLATAVLNRAIQVSDLHGAFAREVRGLDLAEIGAPLKRIAAKFEVTIVASNLPQSGRTWGDHAEEWRKWAREIGFTTDVIDTLPRSSVSENARWIGEHLAKNRHPHRILLTYGQGTSEFRYLLERRMGRKTPGEKRAGAEFVRKEAPELGTIRGWINVCGSFAGALSSDFRQKGWLAQTNAAIGLRIQGRHRLAYAETSTTFPLWRDEAPVPAQVLVASLIGLPSYAQMPPGLRASYLQLAQKGPNDGAVLAVDAVAQPGLVVPISGLTHRAEGVVLQPILQRLLAVTATTMARELADTKSDQTRLIDR